MATRVLYLARHGEAVNDGPLSEAGRRQADLLGRRLADVPLDAVHHGPLPRAAQTAELVSQHLPGVPVHAADEVGDYFPWSPAQPADVPEAYADFFTGLTPAELAEGAALAAAAIERFATPPDTDRRELIITHNFLIGWFVRHAMVAPGWRWLGLNQCNAALTVIRYRAGRPPALVCFNDQAHLPPELRWTGFPSELHA